MNSVISLIRRLRATFALRAFTGWFPDSRDIYAYRDSLPKMEKRRAAAIEAYLSMAQHDKSLGPIVRFYELDRDRTKEVIDVMSSAAVDVPVAPMNPFVLELACFYLSEREFSGITSEECTWVNATWHSGNALTEDQQIRILNIFSAVRRPA